MTGMKYRSDSLERTHDIARTLVSHLSRGTQATTLALAGDLGSGKTAFTQGVARALGVQADITSPTFVIEKVYKLEGQAFERLIHIDAYRLSGGRELVHLGWSELLADPANLVVIEWPELVADVMPSDAKRISFTFIDEKTREIEY